MALAHGKGEPKCSNYGIVLLLGALEREGGAEVPNAGWKGLLAVYELVADVDA
jgi:hypothetical protein